MRNNFSVLCVHQGHELYGSDRTFISSVEAFRDHFPEATINIILPKHGELSEALKQRNFGFCLENIWVARRSDPLISKFLAIVRFPIAVLKALHNINNTDVVYINTSVIFDYAIASRFSRKTAVIHIHEIPTGVAMKVIRTVIAASRAALIFNSNSTRSAFNFARLGLEAVIPNGVKSNQNVALEQNCLNSLRILMIGRINNWKGQDLLIEALEKLTSEELKKISVRFLGSTYGASDTLDTLKSRVKNSDISASVEFAGFAEDPAEHYKWANLVVVPSKKPEPFGLVAIEAMSYSRAVLAANHGGLSEIVVDDVTGKLFPPNDAGALALELRSALQSLENLKHYGKEGFNRYAKCFSENTYKENISNFILQLLPTGREIDLAEFNSAT